jgi:hypothetical protein
MKLTSIGLAAVGLILSATCAMAGNSITTASSNGVGSTKPTLPPNPGLAPATPEQSTGLPLGTLSTGTSVPGYIRTSRHFFSRANLTRHYLAALQPRRMTKPWR